MTDKTEMKFRPTANTLFDQLQSLGIGYYIPSFQRQYSWSKEAVDRLIEDLCEAVVKTKGNHDHTLFIGNFILLLTKADDKLHVDRTKLVSHIETVIDGQQRLCTIAMLAAICRKRVLELQIRIANSGSADSISQDFLDELNTLEDNLQELYSFETRMKGANPKRKPLIIRAEHPHHGPGGHAIDQWTYDGPPDDYYCSDIAKFLSHYINAFETSTDPQDFKPQSKFFEDNVKAIHEWVDRISRGEVDLPKAEDLNNAPFLEAPLDLLEIAKKGSEEFANDIDAAIRLVAFGHVLFEHTWVTSFDCIEEWLAFDMFQSLNSTGEPLSAIDVFKPVVVQEIGEEHFLTSPSGQHFEQISSVFKDAQNVEQKQKVIDTLLLRAGMCFNGQEVGRKFSDQKAWLETSYKTCSTLSEKEKMTQWLAEYADYWTKIGSVKSTIRRDSKTFSIKNQLVQDGLSDPDSDLAALCIYVLKKAGHDFANTVLGIFYSKLTRATGPQQKIAADDFLAACKATLAFFFLYVAGTSKQPDAVYKELFQDSHKNMSFDDGEANQTIPFLKSVFTKALMAKKVFDTSQSKARGLWVAGATRHLTYHREALSKFALLVAAHNRATDQTPGNEGLTVAVKASINPHLTCERWFSADLYEIEHIANQTPPPKPYEYPTHYDSDLYPVETDIVNKIGNLALWGRAPNASTYDEWPDKVFFYATVTQVTDTNPADIAVIKSSLGIKREPPGLAGVAAGTDYIANLAPIAFRGQQGERWTKDFVLVRTQHMCEIIFDHLWDWLH